MGKVEEEQQHPPTAVDAQSTSQNAENRCRAGGWVKFRCILPLLLGAAVLLSAIFWLPPFLKNADQGDLDLDSQFGDHEIVASFMVNKPVSFLEDNILRLQDDIFGELPVVTTKVEIISLKPLGGSNITRVIFGVDSALKNSRLSSTAQSLIRANFVYLVARRSSLLLTASLFGDSFSLEVLRFPGGITVSPPQSAFLWQKVQILFNFTLNFSIDQIQYNFFELTRQLKSGINLAPYENLYIRLTNTKGSTVAPPTIVQSSVLLAVGNTSTMERLRQLAQSITGPRTKNLGLNNTVFGRVKQVSLSSILQHSLHGGDVPSSSPYLAPLSQPDHHRHHHHHHRHNDTHLSPGISPSPATEERGSGNKKGSPASAPVPSPAHSFGKSHEAKSPGCNFGTRKRIPKEYKHSPSGPPVAAPANIAPSLQVNPPMPASHQIPPLSPLPSVVFAHKPPPSKTESDAQPPVITSSVLPLPSSSSAGVLRDLSAMALLLLVLHL